MASGRYSKITCLVNEWSGKDMQWIAIQQYLLNIILLTSDSKAYMALWLQ